MQKLQGCIPYHAQGNSYWMEKEEEEHMATKQLRIGESIKSNNMDIKSQAEKKEVRKNWTNEGK
jgi:hypothetical protein